MTGAVPLGATLLCSEQAAVTAAVTAAGVGAKVESRYKDGRWCAPRRRPAQQPSLCQGACVVGTFFSRACARALAAASYRYAATIVELPSRGWLRIREDLAAKIRKQTPRAHRATHAYEAGLGPGIGARGRAWSLFTAESGRSDRVVG